ncbi:MAG: hypothetical protein JWQ68_1310 [Cryobacterium sp.]|jgi:hypothetical protein|nr:hypothetical protein [Cryobacterium sp.]
MSDSMVTGGLGGDGLADLFRRPGSVSTAYVDVSPQTADPRRTAESQRRALRNVLEEAGAPPADVDVILEIVEQPPGTGGPASRFLAVREGAVEVDELIPGKPWAERIVGHGPVASVLPLLRHRPVDTSYLVVEVARSEGEIRLFRLAQVRPVVTRTIAGETEHSRKVGIGGWSHKHFQLHAEEVWKRNESELAAAIDDIVRENKVGLIVLAGDIRARQLLADQLGPASSAILSIVASHTRAEGASEEPLDDAIERGLASLIERNESDALDRLAMESAHVGGLAESGVGGVVHALQQGQVDTLIIAPDGLGERTLLALGSEPWVAAAPEESLGAPELGVVPAVDALIRAAILTDARVVVVADNRLPERIFVAALLRWPTGPAGASGTA